MLKLILSVDLPYYIMTIPPRPTRVYMCISMSNQHRNHLIASAKLCRFYGRKKENDL